MNKKFAWLLISGSIGLLLNGCSTSSKAPNTSSNDVQSPGSESTQSKTGGQASGSSGAPAQNASGTPAQSASGTPAQNASGTPADTTASKPDAKEPQLAVNPASSDAGKTQAADTAGASTPPLKPGQKNISVDNLPNNMTIITVSGAPITVGEYRRMFKMQQVQLESLAMNNPSVRANLLDQAKKLKLSLSADEKSKLVSVAHKAKAPDEAAFQKFLKDNKITAEQFDNEICDAGLAVKAVNALLQQSLLTDLINREVLCRAGKEAGFAGKAENNYITFKHSDDYKRLMEATKLSAGDIQEEVYKNELSKLMLTKLQGRAAVADKDLKQFYDKNKDKFQHKERIRLSQIIVAAPSVDGGGVQSVRTQLKKENAKLDGKELDDKAKQVMEVQRQKATAILTMAKDGQNFADLANKFSDDMQAKNGKTGGDMGYQAKEQLLPEFAKAIWPLKAGQVYPGLVQTALGFHIIKVTEHQGTGTASLAEIKPQLKQVLMQQKQQQVVNSWLAEKRQNTKIVLAPQFASLLQTNQQTSSLSTLPH
jgi:parvulin-like peptidyl-prolyl isomerase